MNNPYEWYAGLVNIETTCWPVRRSDLFTYPGRCDATLRTLTFWNLGSLNGASYARLWPLLLVGLAVALWLPRRADALNALLLGESEAAHLGVDVRRAEARVGLLYGAGCWRGRRDGGQGGPVPVLLQEFHGRSCSGWGGGDQCSPGSTPQKTSRMSTINCRVRSSRKDAVVHTVGVLARLQDALVAQDGEVLRDVALRCAHRLDDVLHALFATAEHAQDLEAQGVRDCLERARGRFDVLMLVDERGDVVFVHDGAGSGKAIV